MLHKEIMLEAQYAKTQSNKNNTPSIETEKTQLSINSEINSSIGVITQNTKASKKRDREISCRIHLLSSAYRQLVDNDLSSKLIGNKIYQFVMPFDLQKEKVRLKEFLATDSVRNHFKFWEEKVGIYHVNDESEDHLPKYKICITIKYDQENLPEYFNISFASDFATHVIKIDLIDELKKVEDAKKNTLNYFDNVLEMSKELQSICRSKSISNQERTKLLSELRKKWDTQSAMPDIIYINDTCKAEEQCEQVISNHIEIDSVIKDATESSPTQSSNQPPSVANAQTNFWRRNLSTTIAGDLTVGVDMITVPHTMSK